MKFKEIMNNTNEFKYHKPFAEEDMNSNHETMKVVEWIGRDRKVIECGCYTGHLSSWLKKQGCLVTGIEINTEALKRANPYLVQSISGDIESRETWDAIIDKSSDVVTFMHVLEHLKDPETALRRGVERLNDNGFVIIALPNISNATDRFKMFKGVFEYTDMGVMDRTHLRFFNQKTAREMIEGAGLEIVDYYSPWRVKPVKEFFEHVPFFNTVGKFLKVRKLFGFLRFSNNLTDVVMLFKCRKKQN